MDKLLAEYTPEQREVYYLEVIDQCEATINEYRRRLAESETRWSALMDWLITEHRAEQEKARMMIDVTALAEEREVAYGRAIRYMDCLSSTEAVRVVVNGVDTSDSAAVDLIRCITADDHSIKQDDVLYLVGVRDGE